MNGTTLRAAVRLIGVLLSTALMLQFDIAVAHADEEVGELESVFPAPLAEWEAGSIDIERPTFAALGGSLRAARRYRRGDVFVDIRLYLSSPSIRAHGIVLANPELISEPDEALEIAGHRALQSRGPKSVHIIVVQGAAVVEIEEFGDQVTQVAHDYAGAVRYDVLDGVQSQELRRKP